MQTDSWHTILLLLVVMIACGWYDLLHKRVPDIVVLPAIGIMMVLKILLHHLPWWQVLTAPIAGFGVFWAVSRLSGGKLGLGDAKLSALMIVALGALRWVAAVALASAAGALTVVLLVSVGRMERNQPVPFAPFLAVGSAASLLLTSALIALVGVGV